MFMTVALQGEVSPTLLVPEEALVPEQGQAYVFVVHDTSSSAARCAPAGAGPATSRSSTA